MAVFGAVFVVDFFTLSIANYLSTGISARTSYLYGKQQISECSPMFIDFLKISLLLGILIPLIILPITKPLVKWFGSDDRIANMCYSYMIPTSIGSFFIFLYYISCGILQAQGRSVLYGKLQFLSFFLNMCIFDPLFLVFFKTPIWGASLATLISQGLPGLILIFLIFKEKFTLKPTFKMFFQKITSNTYSALRIGFSSWLSSVSLTLPQILMQKYFNNASLAIGQYFTMIQIWAVMEKLYLITGGICIAFNQATLPAVSFAFGANRLNRVFNLGIHALWLSTLLSSTFAIFILLFPRNIAKIWSNDLNYLNWAEKTIPVMFYCAPFFAIQYIIPAVLQGMKRVLSSTLLSILTLLIPLPLFSSLLYFTKKNDPIRIIYTFTCNDIYSFIMCILFSIKPFKTLWEAEKSDNIIEIENNNITNDRDLNEID